MHENDEFSFFIGDLIPTPIKEKLHRLLGQHFNPTQDGEWGRDYYCPSGRESGVQALEGLKQALLRESGVALRFDIEAPVNRGEHFTLTNVIVELK